MTPKRLRHSMEVAGVPSITVKNIPEPLLERLRAAAERSNRSLNRQIIDCLERDLMPSRVDVEATLAHARRLRERGPKLALAELHRMKRRGRS